VKGPPWGWCKLVKLYFKQSGTTKSKSRLKGGQKGKECGSSKLNHCGPNRSLNIAVQMLMTESQLKKVFRVIPLALKLLLPC
jgi:hypothetical protein